MFKKICFYYDSEGQPLEKPRELLPEHCNSDSFHFYDCACRLMGTNHCELPGIRVCRNYLKVKNDPYNEDGRPPTTLFQIIHPHFSYGGSHIEVIGWEDPNLCLAGQLMEPYDFDRCQKARVEGLTYLDRYALRDLRHRELHELRVQKVVFVV